MPSVPKQKFAVWHIAVYFIASFYFALMRPNYGVMAMVFPDNFTVVLGLYFSNCMGKFEKIMKN